MFDVSDNINLYMVGKGWARNLTVLSDDATLGTSYFFSMQILKLHSILKLTLKLLDNFLSTVFLDTKINLNTPLYFLFHLWERKYK